jgi:hypothetical protein
MYSYMGTPKPSFVNFHFVRNSHTIISDMKGWNVFRFLLRIKYLFIYELVHLA